MLTVPANCIAVNVSTNLTLFLYAILYATSAVERKWIVLCFPLWVERQIAVKIAEKATARFSPLTANNKTHERCRV